MIIADSKEINQEGNSFMKKVTVIFLAVLLFVYSMDAQRSKKPTSGKTFSKNDSPTLFELTNAGALSTVLQKNKIEYPRFSPSGRFVTFFEQIGQYPETKYCFRIFDFKKKQIVASTETDKLVFMKSRYAKDITLSFSADESILFVYGNNIALYSTQGLKLLYVVNYLGEFSEPTNTTTEKLLIKNQKPHTLVFHNGTALVGLSLDSLNILSSKELFGWQPDDSDKIIVTGSTTVDITQVTSEKKFRQINCNSGIDVFGHTQGGQSRLFAVAKTSPLIAIPFIIGGTGTGDDNIKIDGRVVAASKGNRYVRTAFGRRDTVFTEQNVLASRGENISFVKFLIYNFEADSIVAISLSSNSPFQGDLTYLEFSDDGRWLVASNGKYSKIWDVETGFEIIHLPFNVSGYCSSHNACLWNWGRAISYLFHRLARLRG